ncbi:hypothetical protein EON82_12400 [bacterium]|nr:MAG: hypothetical protein EON82_12400 [bacterium]
MRPAALLVSAAAILALVGCGNSVDNRPPAAAMAPRSAPAPVKPPTTVEEKVAAIQKSPLSEEQKKAAIEKVRSGGL